MHSLRFLFIPLSLASVVFPRPLQITPVQSTGPQTEHYLPDVPATGPAPHWVPVKDRANKMLYKMGRVMSNPTTAAHQAILDAAFGPTSSRGREKINNTIQQIKNANVRLRTTPTPGETPGARIFQFTVPGSTRTVARMDSVVLHNDVHNLPDHQKAGILIHHAATYATGASSDAVVTQADKLKIAPMGTTDPHFANFIQYSSPRERLMRIPATPAEVDANARWRFLKGATVNMSKSADAYRVFAHLCDTAIPDTEVPATALSKRALLEGEKEAYHSILLRRNAGSCPSNKNAVLPLTNGH